jgi:hypothetical protein
VKVGGAKSPRDAIGAFLVRALGVKALGLET